MGFDFAVWASGLTLNRIFYAERECVLQLPCFSLPFLSVEVGDPTACFNFPLYFSSCPVLCKLAEFLQRHHGLLVSLISVDSVPQKAGKNLPGKPFHLRFVFRSLGDRAFKLPRDPV